MLIIDDQYWSMGHIMTPIPEWLGVYFKPVFVNSCQGDQDDVYDLYKIFLYDDDDLVTLESVPFPSLCCKSAR